MKKTNKKTTTETININPGYGNILLSYVRLYSRLNEEGKKRIENDLLAWGKVLDVIAKKEIKGGK